MPPFFQRSARITLVFFLFFLVFHFLIPLFLPFLIGAALAWASEPVVNFFQEKLRFPRCAAAGAGVTLALGLLAFLVLGICGLLIRQLSVLSGIFPAAEQAVRSAMALAEEKLLALVSLAPDGVRTLLTRNIMGFFSDGSALLARVSDFVLHLASGLLGHLPDGALGVGTGLISSYMISAKLPKIRAFCTQRLQALAPAAESLRQIRRSVAGWLKAQLKLSCITFGIMSAGFLLLRVRLALLCALGVAVVDAFPILGTGTVLVPWALIVFFQGNPALALGLLGLFLTDSVLRSALEPKLVGKQLGLDPLATLMALYVGYRLWGLPGMILSPILAVAAVQAAALRKG